MSISRELQLLVPAAAPSSSANAAAAPDTHGRGAAPEPQPSRCSSRPVSEPGEPGDATALLDAAVALRDSADESSGVGRVVRRDAREAAVLQAAAAAAAGTSGGVAAADSGLRTVSAECDSVLCEGWV